ncbi:MAG: nucleotidyltransferase domain-containing protein [Candidatus Heimdallarchaeota archaeon]|nr:nucleotidyltransferase domain-containing protein [Candidatus Heimdallarchaeota archaeon]MCK4770348.1 nucleotidyltransferase domain-containing protein [Candidatus Heimdallarchaeota archaeon]
MEEKSVASKILNGLKQIVLEDLLDEETLSVMLVGSWADGTAKEFSDIDLVVIRTNQSPFVQNKKYEFQGKILDVWFHDAEYMMKALNKQIESLSDIYQASLYLSFLRKCKVWYEKEQFIQNRIKLCQEWKWQPEHRLFIKMMGKPPKTPWAKNAYEENLQMLALFESQFDNGLPITHRLKDYPELHLPADEAKAKELFHITMKLFEEARFEREWTEVIDAKKAIQNENWTIAFISSKDVLYFLLRRALNPPSMERRDPSLWEFAEDKIIPVELLKALEIAYL